MNMQHVMFENTHAALLECFDHMMDPNVSRSEREFRRSLLALCANAVNAFGDGTEDPDGLVEAFEVEGARTFACAVQWHPEWRCWDNPFYAATFRAFGDAVRQRHARRMRDDLNYATAPDKP